MNVRLDMIGLTVKDIGASLAFYRVLGIDVPDTFEGPYCETMLPGGIRLSWNDLEMIKGKRDQLVGKLRELYGLAKEEAEQQVAEFGRTAGTALRGASQKAKKSGRGALGSARKAGRAAVGAALDGASAGIGKLRGLITPRSPAGRSKAAVSGTKTKTRPKPSK